MHVGAQYVHASCHRVATAAASFYIQRLRECDVRDRVAIVDAATYMLRSDQLERARAEVVGHAWFSRGNARPEDVWPAVDAAARTKTGDYHRRAGGVPRLAILAEFSFPWGLSEDEKVRLAHQLARDIVDEYGAFVEVACHRKQDALENGADHFHLLISMREVDADGRVGKMIRRFNGISSSMSGERVLIGDRALSGHMVWMRKRWAEALTLATGLPYDWRSYADAGIPVKPVTPFGRAKLEKERRDGSTTLRDQRQAELAGRQRELIIHARRVDERRNIAAHDGSLAATIVRANPHLARARAFTPMALLAAKAAARSHAQGPAAPVHQTKIQVQVPRDARGPSSPQAAKPTNPLPPPLAPAYRQPNQPSSHMRPTVAAGASVVPPTSKDPKGQVSSLVERQWAAVDKKQRDAAMQRFFAEIDARAGAAKSAKPVPPIMPVFRIVSEEGVPGINPPRPRSSFQPSPVSDGAIRCAIGFGAGLVAGGWRTDGAEAALAAQVGMERTAFAEAAGRQAIDIKGQGLSPYEVRQLARNGAPPKLLALFDEIEEERKEAKRRRNAQASVTTNQPSVPGTNAPGSSERVTNLEVAKPEGLPVKPIAGAPSPLPAETISARHHDIVFRLAALLAWRGSLQSHLGEIARITGISADVVQAEARAWLQAFAQIKTSRSELRNEIIGAARKTGDVLLIQFVERVLAPRGVPLPALSNPKGGTALDTRITPSKDDHDTPR